MFWFSNVWKTSGERMNASISKDVGSVVGLFGGGGEVVWIYVVT
jgi:hypothetical protein